MAKLVYSMMVSLDGYVAGPDNAIVGAISEEVHAFANQEVAATGIHLYGRRMYETMVYWETADKPTESPIEREFSRVWKRLDKIVYSATLKDVSSGNTRIERVVNPEEIRKLKAAASKDLSVAGPTLASRFIDEGLVDEYAFYVTPVVVGGGTALFKGVDRRIEMELVEERRFGNGVVFVRYQPRKAAG